MSFKITFVVHGYHFYEGIWKVEISSELPCLPETYNREDHHAAVMLRLFRSSWESFFSSLGIS